MATYIYETTDPKKPVRRYEIQQSMKDAALDQHPETGEPIRRVITGGYGYAAKGDGSSAACGSACACHPH